MPLTSRHVSILLPALLCLVLTFALSCDRADRYAGMYIAEGAETSEEPETCIELKNSGQGVWRVLDDEASFRWDVRDNQIRLHTKPGGVIIGKIRGDTLEVALPSRDTRYFKKAKERFGVLP